ncbi:hypothetical protein F5Y18DRAFT_279312 [Xylariaceae sp. FL1019]|nr:hypothetical protein F5Y18DRAFT_279312 [Xylariaceae sp. FL1019]
MWLRNNLTFVMGLAFARQVMSLKHDMGTLAVERRMVRPARSGRPDSEVKVSFAGNSSASLHLRWNNDSLSYHTHHLSGPTSSLRQL